MGQNKNASASAVDKAKQCARTKGDAVREHKAGIGKKSRPLNPKYAGSMNQCMPTEDCETWEERETPPSRGLHYISMPQNGTTNAQAGKVEHAF